MYKMLHCTAMMAHQVRLVALLREPVSRALSSVNMLFQRSPEYAQLKPRTQEYSNAWQAYVVSKLRRWERNGHLCRLVSQ